MKKNVLFKNLCLLLVLILIISCKQEKIDTKAEGEKLMQISREWSKEVASHDVEKIVSYWAEDAVMYDANKPTLKGKAAIRKMVEESFKIPGFKISWEPKEAVISESGDMGYLHEETTISLIDSTGKSLTMYSNGISIWKKQTDGSWKNVVEIGSAK
ncbi:MAG: nuclear transport factor 2 family protein [Bacteroidota bacterium]